MNYDLEKLGMTEEELFSRVDHSDLESEKIAAPKYSYWQSVFRVFFKKKINIVILALLAVVIAFSYLYPALVEYDKFANLMNPAAKHLSPSKAMEMFGHNIHWILGSGAAGNSTFDAVWNGAKISISLAFICGAINMTAGVIVGAIWGFSKKFDTIMIAIYNVIGNIPYLLLISVLVLHIRNLLILLSYSFSHSFKIKFLFTFYNIAVLRDHFHYFQAISYGQRIIWMLKK